MRNTISKLFSIILLNVLLLLFIPTVSAIVTVPDPPQNLTATYITSGIYELDWDEPTNDGGAPITGYQLEIASYLSGGYESEDWISYLTIDAENTNYTDQQTLGYSYGYRVLAINSEGSSLPSNYALVSASEASVPDPIHTDLNLTVVSSSQIDISWDEPDDNGLPIIGYKIDYKVGGDEYTLVENTGNNETSYSHTGLSPNTRYSYKVYGINDLGVGPDYGWDGISTLSNGESQIPNPPTLTVVEGYCDYNIIYWEPQGSNVDTITGYKIEYRTNLTSTWATLVENTNNTNTSYIHEDLDYRSRFYNYKVSAINEQGISQSSSNNIFYAKNMVNDRDCDKVPDSTDNCPERYNPYQEDADNDDIGDVCDDYESPGFELIFVLTVIIAIFFWKRKNKE